MTEAMKREVGARIPRRVLVVDDERRMAQSLQTLLGNNGYEVAIAHTAHEGADLARTGDYPVVVTDLRMPDGSGNLVIEAAGSQPDVMVIVITGHASTESAIHALQHRVFDYITKPFEFDTLRAAVDRAILKLESDRFRDDMVSMITHDVKIPLTSILGYSSLIINRETGDLHPRTREFVQTIHANGLKVLSLLDNFLTSCRIDSGRLTLVFRDTDVAALLRDLLGVFDVEFRRNELTLEVFTDAKVGAVEADESLLYRALANVLSNACKYTPKNGRITVFAERRQATHSPLGVESVVIKVANTGPGIAQEDLPSIFDKYRRSRTAGKIEGSGVGSYVLRYIVEAHGGRVDVDSIPDALTTFWIYLPTRQPPPSTEVS